MRCLLLAGAFLVASFHPVYAGYGTIVETDEAIIVEYTGDAADKVEDKPATPAAPLQQPLPTRDSSRHVVQEKNTDAENSTAVVNVDSAKTEVQVSPNPVSSRDARRAARNAEISRKYEE